MSEQARRHGPVRLCEAAPRVRPSAYPAPFAERMAGRLKRPIGDLYGLTHFGVNHTTLEPGAVSALHHRHTRQDEFILVLEGELVVHCGAAAHVLGPGEGFGFPAGGEAHHLENRSDRPATYLEVGDRTPGDSADYPDDDLKAELGPEGWRFTRKDGRPY